jgi:transporter family-2 protein
MSPVAGLSEDEAVTGARVDLRQTRRTHPSRTVLLGILATIAIGAVLAAQSRINGELGRRLGDGILAALISFGTGLVVLTVLVAFTPNARRGVRVLLATIREPHAAGSDPDRTRRETLRWWQCLGGVCGAFLVVTQATTVGVVGVAVFTVAVVAGQTTSSLVVDRLGVGPAGRQRVTANRVVGAAVALVAVALTVSEQLRAPSSLALALLPALGGVGTAWQQAVNGRVAAAARSGATDNRRASDPASRTPNGATGALVAALVNFAVGTLALLVAAGVDVALRGLPDALPSQPVLYLGGVGGVLFIATSAFLVRYTGVLLLGLGAVAGQVIGALVLDAALPVSTAELTTLTIVGALLTLVAVTIAALPRRG